MTTKTEQDIRYWPTEAGLAALEASDNQAGIHPADLHCSAACLRTGMCTNACNPLLPPETD